MVSEADTEFFKRALKEEGLSDVEVMHYTDNAGMQQILHVRKTVNGEERHHKTAISDRELQQIDDINQYLALQAQQVARAFEEEITEMHEWGEKVVKLDMNEDYSAECFRCGAEVSLNDLEQGSLRMSETAVPQARTGGYKSLPTSKIRMTLLALLKGECEPYCPNSPQDERNIRFDKPLVTNRKL